MTRHGPGQLPPGGRFHGAQDLVVGECLDDVPRRTGRDDRLFDLRQPDPDRAGPDLGVRASHRRPVTGSR